jgi:hypothetical protein
VSLLSPKSCAKPWSDSGDRELDFGELTHRFGRLGVGFWGVDPQMLFIPSCPGVTGLTGASPWWILSRGVRVDWSRGPASQFWACLELVCLVF